MAIETWETLEVDGRPMRAFLALPDNVDEGPSGAVVVIQHAGGVDTFVQEMTRRVAGLSLVAIAPELYHRQTIAPDENNMQRMSRLQDVEIIADVNAVVDFLQADERVDNSRIGIKGYCMGGRIAYMMAGTRPEAFAACIAFYGGNTRNSLGEGTDATPFEKLSRITAPVLSFFGDDDGNPSPEDRPQMDAEITKSAASHEHHSYPNSGHAYMDFTNPQRFSPTAAGPSWILAEEFLGRHLRGALVST